MKTINQTFDPLKMTLYLDYINGWVYDEGESGFHKSLTTQVVQTYIDPLNLPKDARILDLGCGPGYFMDEIKEREYTNYLGITLSDGDIALCRSKGHPTEGYDLTFLPQQDGFIDESVDLIFLRHALEHSPFPIISLIEYNRLLKSGGKLYIEVPAPDNDRVHEYNLNHYSIFGQTQLIALLQRTGFTIDTFNTIEFDLNLSSDPENPKVAREKYYCIMATKKMGLDIR